MENNKFIELAKAEVVKYHNAYQDPVICIDESLVYVVWSCKTLQNNKALLGVAKPDGDMYYETTYNGDRGEMYFDAYKKEKNICISVENPKCESAPQNEAIDCDIVADDAKETTDDTDIYETGCKDCIHAPICEYCADHLENFSLPTDHYACVMYADSLDGVNEEPKTAGGIKYNSPYECTVAGMLSPDYKERFKAEYSQTKIRYEKLKAFCNRIEAARHTMGSDSNKIEEPKHDCPFDLLRGQQRAMGEYLHYLEIRAVIEGIEL